MENSLIKLIRNFEIKNTIDMFSSSVDITEEKLREQEDKFVTMIPNSEKRNKEQNIKNDSMID